MHPSCVQYTPSGNTGAKRLCTWYSVNMRRSSFRRTFFAGGVVFALLLCALSFAWYLLRPLSFPWETAGELSILAYAVPNGAMQDEHIALGLANITLLRADGSHTTIRGVKRTPLNTPPFFERVLTETIPVGTYTGITFTLQSPEVRNAWQGDDAPKGLSLVHDTVELPIPFTIRENMSTVLLAGFETNTAMRTRNGDRVYLPIITVEVREHGEVSGTADGIHVTGGSITHSALYGMQWNGTMRRNLRAPEQPEVSPPNEVSSSEEATPSEMSATTSSSYATTTEEMSLPEARSERSTTTDTPDATSTETVADQ